jgi:hypothetical protein
MSLLMLTRQRFFGLPLSLAFIILLGSCSTRSFYTQLPEAEQRLYRVYSRIMTRAQLKTYRSLPTPAERDAFAHQIGAAQVLDALPEQERTAVLEGHPFKGMSSQALYLMWGTPYLREGPAANERWWYFGDSFTLPESGSRDSDLSSVMEVSIENGIVKWWHENVPSDGRRSLFRHRFFFHPDP